MDNPLEKALYGVTEKFIGYLPSLLAGGAILLLGWFLGWVAKRVVVQVLSVLKPDQLLRKFRWGAAFARADVRYAFYEYAGNFAFLVVFLVLLNASLEALQLTMISDLLKQGVLLIPRLLVAGTIFGFGWLVAGGVAAGIRRGLTKEEVPGATLFARFARGVTILFFASMALVEIDIAREIVIVGFSVTIVTLGVLLIVVTTMGGKRLVSKFLETLEE
jgi:hypothetical protein